MPLLDAKILLYAADGDTFRRLPEHASGDSVPVFLTWRICSEFLGDSTCLCESWAPWKIRGVASSLLSLLSSLGSRMLVPIARHADVHTRTPKKLSAVPGTEFHFAHTAVLRGDHGAGRDSRPSDDLSFFLLFSLCSLSCGSGDYQ